jgi:hypothetical protein
LAATALDQAALQQALSPAALVVAQVLARVERDASIQAAQDAAKIKATQGPVYQVLRQIVGGIEDGKDIRESYPLIGRLIHNQEPRSNVVNQLLLTNDFRRVTELSAARDHLEQELMAGAYRQDLTAAERLVLLKMLQEQLKTAESRLAAGAQPVQDLIGLMQKINFATQGDENALRQRFSQTSPQGREIIRKLVTTMRRAMTGKERDESAAKLA